MYSSVYCEPDIETGNWSEKEEATTSTSLHQQACLLTGSLFTGGTAGEILCGYVQLVDSTYGYCDPKNHQYFLRLEKVSDMALIQGCENKSLDSSTVFYSPLCVIPSERFKKRTYLYVECCFYHIGNYSIQFVQKDSLKKTQNSQDPSMDIPLGWGERLITIKPGTPHGPMCTIDKGILRERDEKLIIPVKCFQENSILLTLKDRYGNLCSTGDALVECSPVGAVSVINPINRHNGEFEIRFFPKDDITALQINGTPVKEDLIFLQKENLEKQSVHSTKNLKTSFLDITSLTLPEPIRHMPFWFQAFRSHSSESLEIFPVLSGACQRLESFENELFALCKKITKVNFFPSWKKRFQTVANSILELEGVKKELSYLETTLNQAQGRIKDIYERILHDNCVELPATLEIEDVEVIEQRHKDLLENIHKLNEDLIGRFENLYKRHEQTIETRQHLTESLTQCIQENREILQEHLKLGETIRKTIQARNLSLRKKQRRREERGGSHPDSIIAYRAHLMKKELGHHIQRFGLQERIATVTDTHRPPDTQKITLPSTTSLFCNDPRNPAFWITEGRFRKMHLHHQQQTMRKPSSTQKHPFLTKIERYGIRLDKPLVLNDSNEY